MKTPWAIATLVLLIALAPAAAVAFRGRRGDRLVGVQATSVLAALFILTFSTAVGRPAIVDLAVAVAVLSFGGALVFVRFLERWL